jgi:hypothetical protein
MYFIAELIITVLTVYGVLSAALFVCALVMNLIHPDK